MPATRLLVLGAIRILQPVHGYDVRRELLTWHLEDLANLKPGSIYGAMRTLEKDGCIAQHGRDAVNGRPERTFYVLTGEGEKEFQLLLHETWWTVQQSADPLVPALCLLPFVPRSELQRMLASRISQLEAELDRGNWFRGTIQDGATGADGTVPEHVREILDFISAKTRAELDWTKTFLKRLRAGCYQFVDETDMAPLGPGVGVRGPVDPAPADIQA